VDFEWIKGVNCLSYQAWEGWLCLWWFWAQKLERTNRGRRELLACRKRAPGVLFVGEAGRPGPTGLGGCVPLPGSVFFNVMISPLWPLCPRAPLVAPPKHSRPQKCMTAAISGRCAYCASVIGRMQVWGPRCMPTATDKIMLGFAAGQTNSAPRCFCLALVDENFASLCWCPSPISPHACFLPGSNCPRRRLFKVKKP
jgi:hypothetical protein